MRRRTFLKIGGAGAAAGALAGAAQLGAWWDQPRAPRRQVVSDVEAEIFESIADTIFPGESFPGGMPPASAVGIVEFYDEYLRSIDAGTQRLLRLLLHAVDEGARVADTTGRRFRDRPHNERVGILRAWDESWFSARRGAYTSLELLIAMGYTEHPAVLEACGIHFQCTRAAEQHVGV